jgi:hypothetical protein
MIYENLHTSLLRFCAEFAEANPGMAVVNFDSHADATQLPASDLVGMAGLSFTEDDGILSIKVLLGISTLGDTNNFRLVHLVSELYERLRPTKRIDVYQAGMDAPTKVGWMVCENGTSVLPVGGEVARPLQYVAVHLATSVEFKM